MFLFFNATIKEVSIWQDRMDLNIFVKARVRIAG